MSNSFEDFDLYTALHYYTVSWMYEKNVSLG